MKAVVCRNWGPPESLTVETLPDPLPGDGEIVIDVKAAGVNFPDVLIVQDKYQIKPELPFTPGCELAGVVSAVGRNVAQFRPGDRVTAIASHGAFATRVRICAAQAMPMPEDLDFETAAVFAFTYGTSYHGVIDRGGLRAGETMLVLGAAGGVGLAAVEIGKALGARIIAAASSDEKLAICTHHGADATINYGTGDLRERIKELTAGKGPDVIYDPVGGPYAEPAFRSIGWGGRYLVIGFASGEIPKLAFNLPLLKNAAVVGVNWGTFSMREPAANAANMRILIEWIRAGKLRPHISRRYALDEAPQALVDMNARKVTGKVVILP